MQGYVLPLALATLLAAPVVWRLGNDVSESPAVLAEEEASTAVPALSLTSFTLENEPVATAEQSDLSGDAASGVVQASTTPPASPKAAED